MADERSGQPPKFEPLRFVLDMPCCKPWRVAAGFQCERAIQQCCAWQHLVCSLKARGEKPLRAFAIQLLGTCGWPINQVHWAFSAAGETSVLARISAERCAAMQTQIERDRYRSVLAVSTSPEFVATFDVLYQAVLGRT